MRVLVLHPEDGPAEIRGQWDLVVDLARAPAATYQEWSAISRCPVISPYSFAHEIDDLHSTRELLQPGVGQLLDRFGIDWWDVLSLMLVPQLQQMMLIRRLAETLEPGSEIHMSRPSPLALALAMASEGKLVNRSGRLRSARQRARHYLGVASNLDQSQLLQTAIDKFDANHRLRRRFAAHVRSSEHPVVLLPSAYVNVSRTAISYARMVPEQEFLLVCARRNSYVNDLPANVRVIMLDRFFEAPDETEIDQLLRFWHQLRQKLTAISQEFRVASAIGVLDPMPRLIRWGIVIRDAWHRVLGREKVTACLCADDTNPYTRIPLILSRQHGIPAMACHHGALDGWMALKHNHADRYLAKSEMELDYLERVCGVDGDRVFLGGPETSSPQPIIGRDSERSWLVFFTEPYHSAGWRSFEVYRELLPQLVSLAQRTGLQLMIKLHPFDSLNHIRTLLKRSLPVDAAKTIEIVSGPLTEDQWQRISFAVTVESTIALDCEKRAIPVFLCGWLRDAFVGYVPQFARFGIGYVMESAAQLTQIPALVTTKKNSFAPVHVIGMNRSVLASLLTGKLDSQMSVMAG